MHLCLDFLVKVSAREPTYRYEPGTPVCGPNRDDSTTTTTTTLACGFTTTLRGNKFCGLYERIGITGIVSGAVNTYTYPMS